MPPRRSVATPASQPIGNVITAAPSREIKLPPFEEDMPQAWYNQAEAYFRLHGVTDRMFWFYYVQWALTPVQKKLARDLLSIPAPRLRTTEGADPSPVRQGREGPLQEVAQHATPRRQATVGAAGRDAAAVSAGRRGRKNHTVHVPVPAYANDAVNVGGRRHILHHRPGHPGRRLHKTQV